MESVSALVGTECKCGVALMAATSKKEDFNHTEISRTVDKVAWIFMVKFIFSRNILQTETN
jgi:hypothetical protein